MIKNNKASVSYFRFLFTTFFFNCLLIYSQTTAGITEINNEAVAIEAINLCKSNEKLHLVIIWPKAIGFHKYIISTINNYGSIFYIKNLFIKNYSLIHILKTIPEKANHIETHLNYYFYGLKEPYNIIVALCEFKNLETAVKCKAHIRTELKLSPEIAALHIADNQKQSLDLALFFFNERLLNNYNQKAFKPS